MILGTDPPENNIACIRQALDVLFEPGDVVEMRIPNYPRGNATTAGYYSDFGKLATDAARHSGHCPGVYVTLNRINPALRARYNNRCESWAKQTTSDTDVLRRRWLPIDVDPVRPAGIPSTDAEHEAALHRGGQIRDDLRSRGWPAPVEGDSGNGGHLLYRIDLPNDPATRELVETCLQALAWQWSDEVCTVDTSVYNAARIWKLYGTESAKGDGDLDRPHRPARLLTVPPELQVVPDELLRDLAARVPKVKTDKGAAAFHVRMGNGFDLRAWIARHGLAVAREGPWQGGYRWVLERCPWNEAHADRAAYIVQLASGAIAAGCHHNGCQGKGWAELRALFEPEHAHRTRRSSEQPATGAEPAGAKPAGAEPAGDKADDRGPPTLELIVAFWHAKYLPQFRRGEVVYSERFAREVHRRELCGGAGRELVEQLKTAADVPRDKKGEIDENALPKHFYLWCGSAWADFRDSLPEEHEGAEVIDSARDEFCRKVAAGLLSMQALGFTEYAGGQEVTRHERRTLINWCRKFAKPGRWVAIRSFPLWCRIDGAGQLRVAVRQDLFGMAAVGPPDLARLPKRQFTELCERYDVGAACRAGGDRCVDLTSAFLTDLLRGPVDVLTDEEPLPRAQEEPCVNTSTQ